MFLNILHFASTPNILNIGVSSANWFAVYLELIVNIQFSLTGEVRYPFITVIPGPLFVDLVVPVIILSMRPIDLFNNYFIQ